METKFKETPIGKIPEDWEVVRLSDVAEDIYYGVTAKAVEKNTGMRMLRTTDIKDFSADWDNLPYCEITDNRNNLQKYLLRRGDLIVARAGTVGVSVLVEQDFDNVIFGSYLIKIRLKPSVFPKFAHYFFQTDIYWSHITKAQGSTLKNINLPLLKSLLIPLPPIEEQRKIAEILSTVDDAIQKVDEAIAKTERLKKGLMQELLTKGIGHTEFKDTEIGRIPKEWEVVRLGDVVEVNPESINPIKEAPEKEFYYIEIDSILDGKIKSVKKIIGKNAPSRARRVVRENDVIMSTVRPYLKAFATVPKKYNEQICSTGFAVLRCRRELIIPNYLLYNLFMDRTIEQCNRLMVGGQYPALNQSHVEQLKIPLPPLPEQQKIAEILSTIDRKLELEKKHKGRLEKIKKGLMNDLLTGRKRVRI